MSDYDRELPNDKGQTCAQCGCHFKYQYLYDDHVPCRYAGAGDKPSDTRKSAYVETRPEIAPKKESP